MLGTLRTKDVNKKRYMEVTIQYNHSATILSNMPSVFKSYRNSIISPESRLVCLLRVYMCQAII